MASLLDVIWVYGDTDVNWDQTGCTRKTTARPWTCFFSPFAVESRKAGNHVDWASAVVIVWCQRPGRATIRVRWPWRSRVWRCRAAPPNCPPSETFCSGDTWRWLSLAGRLETALNTVNTSSKTHQQGFNTQWLYGRADIIQLYPEYTWFKCPLMTVLCWKFGIFWP